MASPGYIAYVTLSSLAEIFFTALVGVFIVRMNLVHQDFFEYLGDVLMNILLPATLLAHTADSITLKEFTPALVLLLASILYILIGIFLGCLFFQKWMKWKSKDRRILILCSSFGNTSAVPLIFVSALLKRAHLFANTQKIVKTAVSYIALFAAPTHILEWTLAKFLLQQKSTDEIQEEEQEKQRLLVPEEDSPKPEEIAIQEADEATEADPKIVRKILRRVWVFVSRTRSHLPSFFDVLPPAVIATVIGLIITLSSTLKNFFVDNPPPIIDSLFSTVEILGQAYFPLTAISIGAAAVLTYHRTEKRDQAIQVNIDTTSVRSERRIDTVSGILEETPHIVEPRPDQIPTTMWGRFKIAVYNLPRNMFQFMNPFGIFMSIFIKQVLLSGVAVGFTLMCIHLGIVSPKNTMLILILMIEGGMPTATSIRDAAKLHEVAEKEISEVLIYQYLFSLISLMGFTVLHLYLVCEYSGACIE